ncbi:MAG: hypothetical protein R3F37_03665 [Candidatus Competibacteraceae bacterium]
MENLSWDGETGISAARFPKLEQEWQELQDVADSAVHERYEQARTRFLADRQDGVAKRIARQDVCNILKLARSACKTSWSGRPSWRRACRKSLQETQQTWEQPGAMGDSEGRRLEQRYQHYQQLIQDREKAYNAIMNVPHACVKYCNRLTALHGQASQVLDAELTALKQQWTSLERPEDRQLMQRLQGEFDAALEKLKVRLRHQEERQDQEWQELTELADELETALDNGELQHAIEIHEQARQRLRKHRVIPQPNGDRGCAFASLRSAPGGIARLAAGVPSGAGKSMRRSRGFA